MEGPAVKRFFLLLVFLCSFSAVALGTQTKKIEIFVTSWCPYCRKLESFLKKSNIKYTRYDVEADAKSAQEFEQLGDTGVPVARVGKEVIHGYDPEAILASLKTQT